MASEVEAPLNPYTSFMFIFLCHSMLCTLGSYNGGIKQTLNQPQRAIVVGCQYHALDCWQKDCNRTGLVQVGWLVGSVGSVSYTGEQAFRTPVTLQVSRSVLHTMVCCWATSGNDGNLCSAETLFWTAERKNKWPTSCLHWRGVRVWNSWEIAHYFNSPNMNLCVEALKQWRDKNIKIRQLSSAPWAQQFMSIRV
jgi:hypothetical protein